MNGYYISSTNACRLVTAVGGSLTRRWRYKGRILWDLSRTVSKQHLLPGTGNITLAGAVMISRLRFCCYCKWSRIFFIQGQTTTEWEVGSGYLSGGTTLVRNKFTRQAIWCSGKLFFWY